MTFLLGLISGIILTLIVGGVGIILWVKDKLIPYDDHYERLSDVIKKH